MRSVILLLLLVLSPAPSRAIARAQYDLSMADGMRLSKKNVSHNREKDQSDVIEEEPESPDPKARASRNAKNIRYNGRGGDLTIREPNAERFWEHIWPRGLPIIPSSESAIIVSGTVIRMQPYLSQDRSRIYAEITLKVEEVFKSDFNLSAGETAIIDRPGGALKLKSGQVVRDDISFKGLGKPRIDGRYILFAERINEGKDLNLIKGYELRDGKVFNLREDGRFSNVLVSNNPDIPDAYSEEKTFLQAVRQETAKPNRKPR